MKKNFYPDLKKTFEEGNFNAKIYKSYFDDYLSVIECSGEKCGRFCQFKKSIDFILSRHKKMCLLKKQNEEVFFQILHDIKSPMIGIKLALENTKRGEKEEEIYKINEEVLNLIRDFLTLYSFESGYRELSDDIFCLSKVVKKEITIYSTQFKYKNLKIRFYSAAKNVLVCSKISIAQRIVSNLISNAIKYAAKGSYIVIKVYEKEEYAAVSVTNRTQEPCDKTVQKVFEKFNTNGDESSFGLGLYICKRLAKKINSRILAFRKTDRITFELKVLKTKCLNPQR